MPYKNTIDAINLQLLEIQKNIAYWEVEGSHQIDIDLALSKIRDVYDLLLALKAETPKIPSKPQDIEQPAPELKANDEITPEEVVEEEAPREIEFTSIDDKEEVQKREEEPFVEKPKTSTPKSEVIEDSKQSSLSEKYSSTRPTLNEELSSQVESEDLAKQLKSRPITNLSTAIGLNEKFEIINNLFHGNKETYESTIEKLNMASNFNEAYNHLSGKLNWDMSDPLVQRLLDLIRRKLITK